MINGFIKCGACGGVSPVYNKTLWFCSCTDPKTGRRCGCIRGDRYVDDTRGVGVGVGVFVENERGQVLMGQRKGSHGEGTWSLPGGHIDFGETPETTCIREVYEETGLRVKALERYEVPYVNTFFKEGKQYITLYFVAKVDPGEPELKEPEKCEGWQWFDRDKLPQPLFGDLETVV